jgi:minor extracellular serine protease Vpr
MRRVFLLVAIFVTFVSVVAAQPSVAAGGVLNAASFAKDASGHGTAVAPGSLVSIFGTGLGTSQADADSVPFSTRLGGVSVTFNGIDAPLRDVIPAAQLVNAQIPFNVLPVGTSGTVNVVVTVNGVQTAPQAVPIVPQAPGVFTIPPGVGLAVLVNLNDGTIAGPTSANIGFKTAPIPRGTPAFFYATGLGTMTPPVANGDGDSTVTHFVDNLPTVLVGGVPTTPLFAGQAGGFPGVYQINIVIPNGAPTGDNIDLQIRSSDGTVTSPPKTAVISVK